MTAELLRRDFDTLRSHGLHPIPVGANKLPFIKWARGTVNYVETMPGDTDRDRWSDDNRTHGWAVACGNKSVKVFTLDVEAEGMAYPQITGVLERLPGSCQRPSPSGGRHAVIVITDGDPMPTQSLARIGAPDARVLLAEVRGVSRGDKNGAYAQITGPGRGPLQPDFAPARMTRAEADALLTPIRALDEPTERQRRIRANRATPTTGTGSGGGTGAMITDAVVSGALSWPQVLEPGWTEVDRDGDRIGLRRPGDPKSAESGNALGPVLVIHSSAVEWTEPGEPMNPPQALAASLFDGDYAAAMRAVEAAAAALVDDGTPPAPPFSGWPTALLEAIHGAVLDRRRGWQAEQNRRTEEYVEGLPTDSVDDAGEDEPESDGTQPEPTSWLAQPLDDVLDGTYRPEEPELMPRTDGRGLLYPGRVHSIHGESESAKSMVMQAESARVLNAGGSVLYLDFESDRASVVRRLLALGADPDVIRARFAYVHPDEPVTTPAARAAWSDHLARRWDLVVVDGVTDAMNVLRFTGDGRGDVNDQATQFLRAVPKRIAADTGAAVVMVDHVTKSQDGRGRFAIGAQSKMAGLTGAAYTLEVESPLAPGKVGELVLRVAKDRPGGVRAHCSARFRASDRTQEAARIVVDSTGGGIEVTVKPPADLDPAATPFRPTVLMGRVSDYLAGCAEPVTLNAVTHAVAGKRTAVAMAVDCLVGDGNVERTTGPRGALLHRLLVPFDPDAWGDDDAGRSPAATTPAEPPNSVRVRVPSREGDAGTQSERHATESGTRSGHGRDAGTQSDPGDPDCEVCGQRLMLDRPGRTVCARCSKVGAA